MNTISGNMFITHEHDCFYIKNIYTHYEFIFSKVKSYTHDAHILFLLPVKNVFYIFLKISKVAMTQYEKGGCKISYLGCEIPEENIFYRSIFHIIHIYNDSATPQCNLFILNVGTDISYSGQLRFIVLKSMICLVCFDVSCSDDKVVLSLQLVSCELIVSCPIRIIMPICPKINKSS
jgi:hypothetical protein